MIKGKIQPMDERARSSWGGARRAADRPRSERVVRRRSVELEGAHDHALLEMSEERAVAVGQVVRDAVDTSLKRYAGKKQR